MRPQATTATPGWPARVARLASLVALTIAALYITSIAAAATEADDSQTTLRVDGMYCTGCEATVQSVLTGLDGVRQADADRHTQTATVTYDPTQITPPEMVQAVNTNTYYRASISDGPPPGSTAEKPPYADGRIVAWAGIALGVAAVVAAGFLLRRAKGSRSNPTDPSPNTHVSS